MKCIVLAAGQGFQLDGCVKLLIKDPKTGEKIIDQLIKIFGKQNLTIVVGYKAIQVMEEYPDLKYIFNADWKITNNSYSLGLAIDNEPCYVISSDLIISSEIIDLLDDAEGNCVLTSNRENRELNSLNCKINSNNKISQIYQGFCQNDSDPEAVGVYKITDLQILELWKKNCLRHGNLFAGQNLNFDFSPIYSIDKQNYRLDEINTVIDFLNLLK